MPLPIDVKPYVLNGVIGGDNYLTHYRASDAEGESFVITEFYPAYMVKREDDGTLGISERFAKEFTEDREEFVRRAEVFREVRDASLHPVVDIFEKNNTAYIVRRVCGLTSVDQFMGSAVMDYDEAYFFIRPLIVSMAMVAEKGMLFNVSYEDFRINSFKQLVLCSPPSWDKDFHKPLLELTRLYYRLVTGAEAPEQGAPTFSAYGIEVPPRIDALIMEILGGDILYGSLDDFHKKFKTLIEGTMSDDSDSGQRTLAAMRGVAAVLFVTVVLSLTFLVYGFVSSYKEQHFWANPSHFADSAALPAPTHDFSALTLTHPRNSADALTGSIAFHSDTLFFRGEDGLKGRFMGDVAFIPGAVGMSSLADDRLIVPNALASHIVGHNRHIYFIDNASGGAIYRASVTGNDLTRITEEGVMLNLAIVGDFLFYTSVDDNYSLWRYNIEADTHTRLPNRTATAMVSSGTYLFYVEKDDTSIYIWDTAENINLQIETNAAGGLRVFEDGNSRTLFYLCTNNQVNSMTFEGRPIETLSPENVRSFDVFFQWIVFTENGTHVPRAYNMDNGRIHTLSNMEWSAHIWVGGEGEILGIDHRNPRLTQTFEFP